MGLSYSTQIIGVFLSLALAFGSPSVGFHPTGTLKNDALL